MEKETYKTPCIKTVAFQVEQGFNGGVYLKAASDTYDDNHNLLRGTEEVTSSGNIFSGSSFTPYSY